MTNQQIKLKSAILNFLDIKLLKKLIKQATKRSSRLYSSPRPPPRTRTASSRVQSLHRVPPTPVRPHVDSKSMDVFFFAMCPHRSPISSHVGRFSRSSMKKSHWISFQVDWLKPTQKWWGGKGLKKSGYPDFNQLSASRFCFTGEQPISD